MEISRKRSARKKISFENVAKMMREYESGVSGKELAVAYGITPSAVSWWAKRYTGLDAKWLRYVKALEHELQIVSSRAHDLTSYIFIAAEVIAKMQPNLRKRATLGLAIRAKYSIPQITANMIVGLSRSAGTGKGLPAIDANIILDMKRYFSENPGQGFDKVFNALLKGQPYTRCEGWKAYKSAALDVSSRPRKIKVPQRIKKPMKVQSELDAMWSMDFMMHRLSSGKRFWILNVIDDFNREALITTAVKNRSTKMVVNCLSMLRINGRTPKALRSDNGGEFKGLEYLKWTEKYGVKRVYSRPHTPTDNVFVERFNLTMRKEVLDRYELDTFDEASRMLEDWRVRYNLARPHQSLGGLSPLQYTQLYGQVKYQVQL